MTRGHPDYYVPHRDSDYPIPSGENLVWGSKVITSLNELLNIIDTVVSAAWDIYIRKITVIGDCSSGDPQLYPYSNALLMVSDGFDNLILNTAIFDPDNLPMAIGTGAYWWARTWVINDQRLPAGDSLSATIQTSNIRTTSRFYVYTNYVLTYSP